MTEIIQARGMLMEEILQSARIAVLRNNVPVEFVKDLDGHGWRVAGMGFVGGLMKPFTNSEVMKAVERGDLVVVSKTLSSASPIYVVRDNREGD